MLSSLLILGLEVFEALGLSSLSTQSSRKLWHMDIESGERGWRSPEAIFINVTTCHQHYYRGNQGITITIPSLSILVLTYLEGPKWRRQKYFSLTIQSVICPCQTSLNIRKHSLHNTNIYINLYMITLLLWTQTHQSRKHWWDYNCIYLHWYVQLSCPTLFHQHSKIFWTFITTYCFIKKLYCDCYRGSEISNFKVLVI